MPNHMYTGADVPQWLQDAFNNCEKVENAQTDVLGPLDVQIGGDHYKNCLLYTSPSPRDS